MAEPTIPIQRHHFVPQFYLRYWYEPGKDGFWLYFRNGAGKIGLAHRPTGSVAYIKNLYSIVPDGLNFRTSVSQEIETEFFARVDDAASQVQEKLVNHGLASLTDADRRSWAVFVNSLLERSPKRIRELQGSAAGVIDTTIARFEQAHPGSAPSPRMRAILARIDKAAANRNAVLSSLTAYIVDPAFIEYVAAMRWVLVDIPAGSDEHFLTGDSPVVVNGGSGQMPVHVLTIALSPSRLLVMFKDAPEFDDDFIGRLTMGHSIFLVQQTEKYVMSSRPLSDRSRTRYARIVDQLLK